MILFGTKDTSCFVCGPDNSLGLQVPFELDGRAGSTATYIACKEHGGWSGILHGGAIFSLMDKAFGWCLYFQSIPAVTLHIETSFHKPIPIGTRLHIRAWITRQCRKLFDAKAEVRIDNAEGAVVAESNAVLYTIPTPVNRKQQKSVETP